MVGQLIQVAQLGCMFPVYSTIYMISPNSEMGKFMKKPFVKFICHSTSYATFLCKYFGKLSSWKFWILTQNAQWLFIHFA